MLYVYDATFAERRLCRRVERATFKRLGQQRFFEIELSMVSEDDIRSLNARTRGVDSVTDVLSFPAFDKLRPPVKKDAFSAADLDGKRIMLGSVVICRKRCEQQAEQFGHSYMRELGFLTCHGLLHLMGYDHVLPEDEEEMTALQREIMAALKL